MPHLWTEYDNQLPHGVKRKGLSKSWETEACTMDFSIPPTPNGRSACTQLSVLGDIFVS